MKYMITIIAVILSLFIIADNLIVIVPDGLATDAYSLMRKISSNPRRDIAFDRVKDFFMYETTADNTYITDSAASGTAIFTGVKTINNVVGQDNTAIPGKKDGKNVENIIEFCKKHNILTGVISNTRITHATPACTYGHMNDRYYEWELGDQLSRAGIDIVMGGGSGNLLTVNETCPITGYKGKRKDGITALKNAIDNGYTFIKDREEMDCVDINDEKILGIFSFSHMSYEWDKPETEPTLTEMSQKAIEFLHNKSVNTGKDFFIMIEAGRIDHAAHEIDTDRYMWEVFEYEKLSNFIMDYCDSTQTTLLIIPDHATANPIFAGTKDSNGHHIYDSRFIENDFTYPDKDAYSKLMERIDVSWTLPLGNPKDDDYRGEHTGSDLLGLMYGKHSDAIRGFIGNDDFFEAMKEILEQ